jgi:hypothetical protein
MAQQTFEEIVAAVKQAESRGKRYKDDGKTLTTSPKGALGEMQVMPKTILNPGFGVTPAKDKSPDEIARVGVDYLQAMKQKYGDTEKALIAYNWGPGSTDKWIAAGANPEKLPAETKTYVERVKGLLGKNVSRETSVAKTEPTPAEEIMTKALPAGTTASVSRETMMKGMPDVKNMPASYQAAFALAALADAQDEEDDRVYNENKETESEKLMRDYKPVNHLASLDLSVAPVMMADGGEVDAEDRPDDIKYFSNANRMKDRGTTTDSVMLGARTKAGEGSVIAGLNMANMSKDEKMQTARALMLAYTQQDPEGLGINANVVKPQGAPAMANLIGSLPVGEGRVSAGVHGNQAYSLGYNRPVEGGQFNANLNVPRNNPSAAQLNLQFNKRFADGGEVTEMQDTARKGEAYQALEKYLQSRDSMPSIKIGNLGSEATNGVFTADRANIGDGTIKISKDTAKEFIPSVLTHEMTHAADRQMMQQALEQKMFGKSNQFTEAYEKMVGPEGRNRTLLLRKRYPEFEQDNRYYRSEPKEVAAHGVGAYAGPNIQDRAPRHVDATAATEFQILMDLAQRNVDKGPKGLAKIPAFFRKLERYADGGEVEGERLTPQQIERLAAQETADREAASNAAFIAQKSGIGRKEGNISKALKSGEGQVEFAKGMTNIPQNILGAPMDISNMVASIYGGNVEKPFMGSEYLKEKSRAAGLGFTPSTDPTLAGFYGAGDLASNLVNPAGVTRSGVKVAGKTGEAAKMLGNMAGQEFNAALMGERPGTILDTLTAPAQPKFIRRPAGGVFPTAKNVEEEPISGLDKSIKSTLDNNLSYVRAPDENKEAAKQFIDTKLRDYFKTKASSVSDPLREALINGRIKIPKDSPLEEQFPQALISASRAGDVTAMREIENRFDKMMNISNYRLRPAGTGPATDREATEAFKQTILQQMKANPSVIPDEFLLRLAKKDTSKLSKQEQAAEVAGIRQKLADNPTLFNTVIEPKMTRLLSDQVLETVNPDSLTQFADLYPALVNAPKRQEGIMALQADVPITDVNYMGIPEIFGIGKSDLIEELTKISPKDLAQMSVPEFYAKAIPSVAKKEVFRENVRTVDKLAKEGKPVPAELGQFGTKEFLPTDQQGMTWREVTDPKASLIQAKFLNNSIGGYAEPGTYGPLNSGMNALKNGEVRLFSLYDKNGHAVNNVEFVTPKVANDPKYSNKANTITQMNGNGVRTGNVVPEQYPQQMMDLIDALKPKSFPPSIKDLIYNYTNGITPPAPVIPPNPPGWGNINLAHGGMIERQPNDNRRYL